jgi:hypothetical protein
VRLQASAMCNCYPGKNTIKLVTRVDYSGSGHGRAELAPNTTVYGKLASPDSQGETGHQNNQLSNSPLRSGIPPKLTAPRLAD